MMIFSIAVTAACKHGWNDDNLLVSVVPTGDGHVMALVEREYWICDTSGEACDWRGHAESELEIVKLDSDGHDEWTRTYHRTEFERLGYWEAMGMNRLGADMMVVTGRDYAFAVDGEGRTLWEREDVDFEGCSGFSSFDEALATGCAVDGSTAMRSHGVTAVSIAADGLTQELMSATIEKPNPFIITDILILSGGGMAILSVEPESDPSCVFTAMGSGELTRLNEDGSVAWTRMYPSINRGTVVPSHAIEAQGGILFLLISCPSIKTTVVKTDGAGNYLVDTELEDITHSDLLVADDGSIFVAGSYYPPDGPTYLRVVKLDPAGGMLWTRDFPEEIDFNPGGSNIDVDGGLVMGSSSVAEDIEILKIDADGAIEWTFAPDY